MSWHMTFQACKLDAQGNCQRHYRVMTSTIRRTAALVISTALLCAIVACGTPEATSTSVRPPTATTATPSPVATKPFPVV